MRTKYYPVGTCEAHILPHSISSARPEVI